MKQSLENIAYVDNELLTYFKERWSTFSESKEEDFTNKEDFEIMDILKSINSIPGVVTVWSCAGHKGEEQDLYLAMTGNKEGMDNIRNLYHSLCFKLLREKRLEPWTFQLEERFLLNIYKDKEFIHPVLIIRSSLKGSSLIHFRNTLRKVLK